MALSILNFRAIAKLYTIFSHDKFGIQRTFLGERIQGPASVDEIEQPGFEVASDDRFDVQVQEVGHRRRRRRRTGHRRRQSSSHRCRR